MKKKVLLAVLLVVVAFAALAGVKALQIRAMDKEGAAFAPPAEAVTSAIVEEQTWQQSIQAIGSVAAVQGVNISAETGGAVTEISFESGSSVEAGELLVQLEISTEKAQLRSAQADVDIASLEFKRSQELKGRNFISQSEWDTAKSKLQRAEAEVENMTALIAKKTIRAPFAGRLGIRQINLGEVLTAGQPIVSLQALDVVHVNFSLPEQRISALKEGMQVVVTSDAFPEEKFSGALSVINPELDSATRSIPLQATLENPGHLLRPGMFAQVALILPGDQKIRAIPATAVAYAPFGDSVYVIEEAKDEKSGKEQKVLRQQFVRLGQTRGDFVEVVSGIEPGQTIAGTGVFKLRNGMSVIINNDLAPVAKLAPTPADS